MRISHLAVRTLYVVAPLVAHELPAGDWLVLSVGPAASLAASSHLICGYHARTARMASLSLDFVPTTYVGEKIN